MRRASKYLLMPALAALLLSCVNDNELCPSDDTADKFTLNINISAQGANTRTAGHGTATATNAEEFINIDANDYAIYILDDKQTVIEQFDPIYSKYENGSYRLSGPFTPTTEKVSVMVLANWKTDFNGSYTNNIVAGSTALSELYANKIDFNFTMPTGLVDMTSWEPKSGMRGIPMFGLSEEISVPESVVTAVVEIKDIPMIRALAKIEVVNATNDDKIDIAACRLTRHGTSGRFIPDGTTNPDWNIPGTQVIAPSLPDGSEVSTEKLVFARSEDGKTLTAYIPEMTWDAGNETERPVIEVDLSINGSKTVITRYIEFGTYTEGVLKEDSYLNEWLRNHRYHFNINSVEGVGANLTLMVDSDWEAFDSEFDYRDAAAVFEEDRHFTWTTSAFEESGLYEGRTLLVDPDGGAEASFTMTEPKLGTWTLALYGGDDTHNDAFRIEIWDDAANDGDGGWNTRDGESPDAITRPVDGKEVKIRIVATGPSDSAISYTARLVMTVKTFDDRIAEVNLPHAEDNPMLRPTIANNGYYFVKQTNSGL